VPSQPRGAVLGAALLPSDAILFLCFFEITMYYTYREAQGGATHRRTTHTAKIDERHAARGLSTGRAILYPVAGLVYGGELIVAARKGNTGTVIGTSLFGLLCCDATRSRAR
jgi:hypothetical protein